MSDAKRPVLQPPRVCAACLVDAEVALWLPVEGGNVFICYCRHSKTGMVVLQTGELEEWRTTRQENATAFVAWLHASISNFGDRVEAATLIDRLLGGGVSPPTGNA